jgi:hypothetical protein
MLVERQKRSWTVTLKLILAALLAFPTYKEDRGCEQEKVQQLELVAANLRMTSLTTPEMALTIAWGKNETNYSLRIHRGECQAHECPNGARSPWQFEFTPVTEAEWPLLVGIENTGWQVARAAWFVHWAMGACGGDARCAFRRLGGLAPDEPLRGEEQRVADFERVRRML